MFLVFIDILITTKSVLFELFVLMHSSLNLCHVTKRL